MHWALTDPMQNPPTEPSPSLLTDLHSPPTLSLVITDELHTSPPALINIPISVLQDPRPLGGSSHHAPGLQVKKKWRRAKGKENDPPQPASKLKAEHRPVPKKRSWTLRDEAAEGSIDACVPVKKGKGPQDTLVTNLNLVDEASHNWPQFDQ